jgi:hypothetical protein
MKIDKIDETNDTYEHIRRDQQSQAFVRSISLCIDYS